VRTFYIWGIIRYTDFTGIPEQVPFCSYVLGKSIFGISPTTPAKQENSYGGPYQNCD